MLLCLTIEKHISKLNIKIDILGQVSTPLRQARQSDSLWYHGSVSAAYPLGGWKSILCNFQ